MSEKMHRVYLRDWYFNAGIVGFLKVLTNSAADLNEAPLVQDGHLVIGDNFIEFDNAALEGFTEKFTRMAFLKFFDQHSTLRLLDTIINGKPEKQEKVIPVLKSKLGWDFIQSFEGYTEDPNEMNGFYIGLKKRFEQADFFDKLSQEQISTLLIGRLRKTVFSFGNKPSSEAFKTLQDRLIHYIELILKISGDEIPVKKRCVACSSAYNIAEIDFNTAVSSFNGWASKNIFSVWGASSSAIKICPVCALVYLCSFLSFEFLYKNKNYFYSLNQNNTVHLLYSQSIAFGLSRKILEESENSWAKLLSKTLALMRERKLIDELNDIDFVEMEKNVSKSNESADAYLIRNYHLGKDLAIFLSKNEIPGGYVSAKNGKGNKNFNVETVLLGKVLTHSLDFSDLGVFFDYKMREGKGFSVEYKLRRIVLFIAKYISNMKQGGEKVAEKISVEKLVNIAWSNGNAIRKKIHSDTKVEGIAYQLLNDLKVMDKESFLDKYFRLIMSYKVDSALGSQQQSDENAFLQFGYSFVNGLLKKEKNEGENNG